MFKKTDDNLECFNHILDTLLKGYRFKAMSHGCKAIVEYIASPKRNKKIFPSLSKCAPESTSHSTECSLFMTKVNSEARQNFIVRYSYLNRGPWKLMSRTTSTENCQTLDRRSNRVAGQNGRTYHPMGRNAF